MTPFHTLYLDMNSFFASVEQHLDPALRGRPLGITAMEEEVGICVAASVEAKKHGVRTGTPIIEAKRLCPGIAFRPSRHRLYVRWNLQPVPVAWISISRDSDDYLSRPALMWPVSAQLSQT